MESLACIVKQHYAWAKKLDVIMLGFTEINAVVYIYQLQVYYEQCTAYCNSRHCMCLAAENLRGGRYYIGAVKIAERMVVRAVNAEVL